MHNIFYFDTLEILPRLCPQANSCLSVYSLIRQHGLEASQSTDRFESGYKFSVSIKRFMPVCQNAHSIFDLTIMLKEGTRAFNFSFPIPSNCPNSFEGNHGHIRYVVDARIYRPKWKVDLKTKKPFTVLSTFDLNTDPNANKPSSTSSNHTVRSVGKDCGEVVCTLNLARQGFVAGEIVPVLATIENNSTLDIENAALLLVQEVTYFAFDDYQEAHQRHSGKAITRKPGKDVIEKGKSAELQPNEEFRIPTPLDIQKQAN